MQYAQQTRAAFLGGPDAWPVAGDFDGDGFADPGVYFPASGIWQVKLSSLNYNTYTAPWPLGGPGYFPAPGDYDGDGLMDPAVRNISGKIWMARLSGQAYRLFVIPLGF